MKEAIYTIPVNEAFEVDCECPFCQLHQTLEKDAIDYMLGASYMEDDIRMETNKIGFCAKHYDMMYKEQNRLGLALMVDTHLQKVISDLENLTPSLYTQEKKSLFSKSAKTENKVSTYLSNITNSCYICNKIDNNFDRYFDTFFYMWQKDSEMKNKVKNSKGFCFDHFNKLISMGKTSLKDKEYTELLNIIVPLEIENLKRLEKEVELFTDKFDHRFKDVPWGTAKDSLIRAMLKTASTKVEE